MHFIIILFISGFGIGAPSAQLVATALADVPSEKNGLASGLNNIIQKIFMLVLTAIMTFTLANNLDNAYNKTKNDLITNVYSSQVLDQKTKNIVIGKLNTLTKTNSEKVQNDINLELQKNNSLSAINNMSVEEKKQLVQKQNQIVKYLTTTIKGGQDEMLTNSSNSFTSTFKMSYVLLVIALLLCPFVNPNFKKRISPND